MSKKLRRINYLDNRKKRYIETLNDDDWKIGQSCNYLLARQRDRNFAL